MGQGQFGSWTPLLIIAGECWRHSETENVLADFCKSLEPVLKEVGKMAGNKKQSHCTSLLVSPTSSEGHRFIVAHGDLLVSHQDTSTQHHLLAIFFALLERSLLYLRKVMNCNNPMQASIPEA